MFAGEHNWRIRHCSFDRTLYNSRRIRLWIIKKALACSSSTFVFFLVRGLLKKNRLTVHISSRFRLGAILLSLSLEKYSPRRWWHRNVTQSWAMLLYWSVRQITTQLSIPVSRYIRANSPLRMQLFSSKDPFFKPSSSLTFDLSSFILLQPLPSKKTPIFLDSKNGSCKCQLSSLTWRVYLIRFTFI